MAGIGGVEVDEAGRAEGIVWYGPHGCSVCGATIIKASRDQGGAEFDVPARLMRIFQRGAESGDPHIAYPQTWVPHVHRPQEERPPLVGSAACGGAASSPTPELALFTSSEWDLIGFILGEAVYEDEDAGRDADAQMIRDLSRRAERAALTRKAEIASSEPAAPVRPVQETP